jgi:hypothetical protein
MTYRSLKSGLGLALVALLLTSSASWAQTVGAAQSFAIVGGAGVHFNGAGTTVNGDVGIDPAAATFITGYPGNATILPPFANHGNDGFAIAAAAAAQILYDSAAMAPAGGVVTGANLSTSGPTANGQYTPGKYFVSVGTAIIPTTITLTTPGLYIFTLNSDLTAAVGSSVILGPGVNPCNVWWRVPTQAALNGARFVGNVVSNAGISLGVGAVLEGRALTTDPAQVTFAGTNTVSGCSSTTAVSPPGCPAIGVTPSALPFGAVGVSYTQQLAGVSGTAPYTFALLEALGTLPVGLTLSSTGALTGTPTVGTSQTFTIRVTDTLGCATNHAFAFIFGINVPTLPQMFALILTMGLLAAGYYRLRRRANPFAGGAA